MMTFRLILFDWNFQGFKELTFLLFFIWRLFHININLTYPNFWNWFYFLSNLIFIVIAIIWNKKRLCNAHRLINSAIIVQLRLAFSMLNCLERLQKEWYFRKISSLLFFIPNCTECTLIHLLSVSWWNLMLVFVSFIVDICFAYNDFFWKFIAFNKLRHFILGQLI